MAASRGADCAREDRDMRLRLCGVGKDAFECDLRRACDASGCTFCSSVESVLVDSS